MKKILPLLLFSFISLFVFADSGYAQGNSQPAQTEETLTEFNYLKFSSMLNDMDKVLKSGSATPEYLQSSIRQSSTMRSLALESKKTLEQDMQYTQKKLDALGEAPEGGKESKLLSQKRKEFTAELDTQKGKVAEADVILARLDETDTRILNLRSKELFGNLFNKQKSLINPANFFEVNKFLLSFLYDIAYSPINWYESLNDAEKAKVYSNVLPAFVIFILSLILGVYLRLLIMRKFGYDNEIEHPRYGKKVSAAVCVAIGYGVIPSCIIAGMLIWIASSEILTGYFAAVIGSFLFFSLYVLLGRAIARVVFAPYNEKWRLVNVNNDKALSMASAFYGMIYAIGLFGFLEYISDRSDYNIDLSAYISAIGCFVKAFFIWLIVRRSLWDGLPETDDDNPDEEDEETQEDDGESSSFKITFFTTVAGIILCLIAICGYPFLSSFILNRIIMTFILLGFLFIVRKAFEEIMHRVLLMRFWAKNFRIKRKILSKLNFWISLVVDPLFVLIAIYMILALWGVSVEILNHGIYKIFTGFNIGGIKISLVSIFLGLVIFFVAINVVRILKRRLAGNVLSKMDIDEGIKASLESGFGSVGYVLSALLAIAIMGGDLGNLALIAGALSVGIGLGLQNVVNNFVSGIILLFERPIKVGDWVSINGEEGRVKQINIRATEVETFKKTSLIIPNANLLSTTVTNLTHSDNSSRMSINVGVAYGSDTRRVAEILLECAEAHKRVLKKPAPSVLFKDFGPSSLDFELRCYTSDIWTGWMIPSDLRFEIDRRFREEGIEIPFPQQTITFGDADIKKALLKKLQNEVKAEEKAKKKAKTKKSEDEKGE